MSGRLPAMIPYLKFSPLLAALFFPPFVFAQVWTQTSAPTNNSWQSIASSADGNTLVAVSGGSSSSGQIYSSTNGGLIWATNSAPAANWISVACSADASHLIAGASGGMIYTSTNSGAAWQTNSAGNNHWYEVACSADGSRLAASGPAFIITSTNGGTTWVSNRFTYEMPGLRPSADGTRLMAGDSVGSMVASTNSGANWSRIASVSGYVNSIAVSADGTRWAVATGTGIFTSTNLGATWKTNSVPSYDWRSIASSADGNKLIACGGSDLIYISTNGGASWQSNGFPSKYLSYPLSSVTSSADGTKLATTFTVIGGGIWGAQSISQPQLKVCGSSVGTKIFWTVPSMNFVLQQSSNLENWANATNTPQLNSTNLQNEVFVPISNGNAFYRLKTQ